MTCKLRGESWQIGAGPHVCPPKNQQIGVDTFVHPPPDAEALAAVELFESVGAHEFGVTVKDETSGWCDYEVMESDEECPQTEE